MNLLLYFLAGIISLLILLKMHKRWHAKGKVIQITENQCKMCGRCVKTCRHRVLEAVHSESGRFIALKNPEKCTACGNCVTACKFNALELVDRTER